MKSVNNHLKQSVNNHGLDSKTVPYEWTTPVGKGLDPFRKSMNDFEKEKLKSNQRQKPEWRKAIPYETNPT